MKSIAIFAVFTVLWVGSANADNHPISPDWTLAKPSGESIRLSEVIGEQPAIILFWASWCPYCKALMPHLQSIELEYGDRVQVLAVNFRDKGDAVSFVADAGYDFTVLPNGEEVAKLYEIWGTPGVLIVDEKMRVRFDLRDLPPFRPELTSELKGHAQKAGHRAPYWAAEIRKALSALESDSSR